MVGKGAGGENLTKQKNFKLLIEPGKTYGDLITDMIEEKIPCHACGRNDGISTYGILLPDQKEPCKKCGRGIPCKKME